MAQTTFRDELRGDITFEHTNVDDQVLLKSDGFPTYHLANVVDDHLMEITARHPRRGVDLLHAEARAALQGLRLGAAALLAHAAAAQPRQVQDLQAQKPRLADYYREAGFLPEALLNFLGLMGGGMPSPTAETAAVPAAAKASEAESSRSVTCSPASR